jgi:hypothetical protein
MVNVMCRADSITPNGVDCGLATYIDRNSRAASARANDSICTAHGNRGSRSTAISCRSLRSNSSGKADRPCNAQRYERSEARRDTRAGHYERKLQTKAGEVRLKVPKLRAQTFETAIIERYRRRESSVEEALIEMYLAGVSVRRVEDITEALWGTRVSPSTVSDLNKKIYATIEAWRNRPIEGEHPYVCLDGTVLKRSWAGEVRNVSLLVAIGVNESGYREILGICEGAKEDKAGWSAFLKHLKDRGLKGIRLITSMPALGLPRAPRSSFQRLSGKGASYTGVRRRAIFVIPKGQRPHPRRSYWRSVNLEDAADDSADGVHVEIVVVPIAGWATG